MAITMGNDEFILYIRKRHPECRTVNAQLGKSIWKWLRESRSNAEIVTADVRCVWGDAGEFVSDVMLPKTATQFSFDEEALPRLYRYLDELGEEGT